MHIPHNRAFSNQGEKLMKYLIIGNGPAGTEAAAAIRKHDADGEITVLSASSHLYYYRPKLVEYLCENISIDSFTLFKPDFYASKNIENKLGVRIKNIVAASHEVIDENGLAYSYDKLLIATGARSFIPPMDGFGMRGTFSLRSVTDADNMKTFLVPGQKVVIAGAGLLGLESANSIKKIGCDVTVIDNGAYLLSRQLDLTGAGILETMLKAKGLNFIYNDTVAALKGGTTLSAVTLKSGEQLEASALLVSAGVRPRIELAKDCGIETDRAIKVNDLMQTSAPDVFAAGDCAEWNGKNFGLWPIAREQGMCAGANMTGAETTYKGLIPQTVLKITEIDLYSAGEFNAGDAEVFSAQGDSFYKKIVVRDKKAIGAIVIGDAEAVKRARQIMDGKLSPDELLK